MNREYGQLLSRVIEICPGEAVIDAQKDLELVTKQLTHTETIHCTQKEYVQSSYLLSDSELIIAKAYRWTLGGTMGFVKCCKGAAAVAETFCRKASAASNTTRPFPCWSPEATRGI